MKQFVKRRLIGLVALVVGLAVLTPVVLAEGPVHWTYEGPEGPEHWGELSPDYALCSTGAEQSPIDIPAGAPVNPAGLGYNYQPSAVNIFNNGHTVQVNYDPGSTLQLDNDTYELVQFHFHAASEHTGNGQHAPMEMHLVHRNTSGGLAVVGVWLESGDENAAFAPVFNNLPATEGDPVAVPGETVNADNLLPGQRTYHRYSGSLTTPPCTQGVKWVMLNNPVELSATQIAAFTGLFDNNYRPVQPLNERAFLTGSQQPAPAALPATGGPALPIAGGLAGLGALGIVIGSYLYRRTR